MIFAFERTQCQPRSHLGSHFSHAKAQERSDNLPRHKMGQVYQSMTRGWLYHFFYVVAVINRLCIVREDYVDNIIIL